MYFDSNLSNALDRISERAADVRRAYTPGALPQHDDVETPAPVSDFTLDPLSAVAPDDTYFIAGDDHGRKLYTRDGAFTVRGGTLVDSSRRAIQGARRSGEALAALRVDPIDEALGRVHDLAIDRDGTVSYERASVDPRSGDKATQRVAIGRIALARFPAGTRLETHDGSHGSAPDGVSAQVGFAQDGSFGPLVPMHRERSRIDVDGSLVRLKDAYLAFDALQAAQAAKGHLSKTAMDLLK